MLNIFSFTIYLLLNFFSLWISIIIMDDAPNKPWYLSLEHAPWTPPSWLFGVAWFTIMICFAIFMTAKKNKQISDYISYIIILILCVSWNYFFFDQHNITLGLVNLIILTIIVLITAIKNYSQKKIFTLLMLPFCIWTILATSLNLYLA